MNHKLSLKFNLYQVSEQPKSKSKTKDEGTEIKEASISPPIKKRISGESMYYIYLPF